jgi:anaerobic ribonucleoside-triphosphate reductase activating protein
MQKKLRKRIGLNIYKIYYIGSENMGTQLRVAGTVNESIVDGPGIRYVIFTQGCSHNCVGCHNPQTHDFDGGSLIDINEIIKQVKRNPLLDGITFSGGEPFEQADVLSELAKEIKAIGLNVMTYTGYTLEYINKNKAFHLGWEKLLSLTDILVDGKFEITKKNLLLKFRGSENQRIIDVGSSMKLNSVVEIKL